MSRMAVRTLAAAGALALAGVCAPAAAQLYSPGYEFLQAVEDALNGGSSAEVNEMLAIPGTTVVNAQDLSTGRTALHMSVERRNAAWIDFLKGKGANVNLADRQGVTPLMLAVQSGFVEGAERLIAHGARVDVTNNAGETPLMFAVHGRNAELMRILLQAGADPDRNDHSGRSARDYARLRGANDITVQTLNRYERQRDRGEDNAIYGPSF